jgi:hypothetical protein
MVNMVSILDKLNEVDLIVYVDKVDIIDLCTSLSDRLNIINNVEMTDPIKLESDWPNLP